MKENNVQLNNPAFSAGNLFFQVLSHTLGLTGCSVKRVSWDWIGRETLIPLYAVSQAGPSAIRLSLDQSREPSLMMSFGIRTGNSNITVQSEVTGDIWTKLDVIQFLPLSPTVPRAPSTTALATQPAATHALSNLPMSILCSCW